MKIHSLDDGMKKMRFVSPSVGAAYFRVVFEKKKKKEAEIELNTIKEKERLQKKKETEKKAEKQN